MLNSNRDCLMSTVLIGLWNRMNHMIMDNILPYISSTSYFRCSCHMYIWYVFFAMVLNYVFDYYQPMCLFVILGVYQCMRNILIGQKSPEEQYKITRHFFKMHFISTPTFGLSLVDHSETDSISTLVSQLGTMDLLIPSAIMSYGIALVPKGCCSTENRCLDKWYVLDQNLPIAVNADKAWMMSPIRIRIIGSPGTCF